ncbi:DUF6939 family protein [Streptomyces sp. NPDC001890]|uniref:DUF6939 family protein n=1 Tax=Streptomyces sp. NPDC001890 TaxID=3364620 RepID=UPI00368884C8
MASGRAHGVAREQGVAAAEAGTHLCVDTYRFAPAGMARFRTMNPYHRDRSWRIPVPGTGLTAESVESVWQGLKLVDGETCPAMFGQDPAARPPGELRRLPGYDYAASVFQYGDVVLGLFEARLLIYLPTYLHLLDRLADDRAVVEIHAALRAGRDVLFYDYDANMDPAFTGDSWSHSSILAAWFNDELDGLLEQSRTHRARLEAGSGGRLPASAPLPLDRYRALHRAPQGELA